MGRETDSELIEATRRGDQAAFGAIVERYQQMVSAVAFSSTHDRALSEDVAQDTFVTAWDQLGGLRDSDRLPGWLCGIARNLARSARRRTRRETPSDTIDVAATGTPFDALSETESDSLVSTALREVPERYREPLVLFYYEQQSVTDASRALGISESTMHQRLSRGRQYLAAGVQSLVERTLERRRPRRDLAAAVLAVLALTRASHVAAAATRSTKGTAMMKTGIVITAIAATAVGASVVAMANSHRSNDHTTTSSDVTAKHVEAATTATTPALRSSTARAARSARPIPTLPSAAPPSCAETTRYLASLALQATSMEVDENVFATSPEAERFEQTCVNDHWSDAMRSCVVEHTDLLTAMTTCQPQSGVMTFEVQLPADQPLPGVPDGTVQFSGVNGDVAFSDVAIIVPAYTGNDVSCAAVGAHLAMMTGIDPAELAKMPAEMQETVKSALAGMNAHEPQEFATQCDAAHWSEATRRCVLAATKRSDVDACD
ncbi:MAG TPA: sigma-70 family RNA polymerase sigma factor [Kofleriaceae bacterium]|jgi:RNA polymerase sigma factor (sigma-70 family)